MTRFNNPSWPNSCDMSASANFACSMRWIYHRLYIIYHSLYIDMSGAWYDNKFCEQTHNNNKALATLTNFYKARLFDTCQDDANPTGWLASKAFWFRFTLSYFQLLNIWIQVLVISSDLKILHSKLTIWMISRIISTIYFILTKSGNMKSCNNTNVPCRDVRGWYTQH